MRAAEYGDMANQIDQAITRWMARNSILLLRLSIAIVFIWFGALKFLPGMSPAEDLVRATLPFLPGALVFPLLGAWEIVIGLGFLSGRFTRVTLLLLFAQMAGTLLPLVLLPERIFHGGVGLTLEGQYIIKNLVLISSALVVGATARGGALVPERQP